MVTASENNMLIHKVDRLLGSKFWALFTPFVKPAYRVFRYVGWSEINGVKHHYFTAYRGPKGLVSRSETQLKMGEFYPFCMDYEQIMEAVKAKEEPNAAL